MQVVYFVITFIEIILTIVAVYCILKATRALDCANYNIKRNIREFDEIFNLIVNILNFSSKIFEVYDKYKDSIKEFKNVTNAFLTIKKLIDTYAFLSSLAAIKKLSLILVLKKLLFKKRWFNFQLVIIIAFLCIFSLSEII